MNTPRTPLPAGATDGPRLTYGTSNVRLACAVRKMGAAETVPAVIAIKDAAKAGLLPRDLPKLKEAFDKRLKHLRSIKPNTDLPTTEGKT